MTFITPISAFVFSIFKQYEHKFNSTTNKIKLENATKMNARKSLLIHLVLELQHFIGTSSWLRTVTQIWTQITLLPFEMVQQAR